jgi:uracil-DNA glycosylase
VPRTWKTRRLLDNPDERRRRRARRAERHVAPLNRIVYDMRHDATIGADGPTVPYVDPDGGGVDAKVLFLLRDPSDVAASTTGLISPDNPDPTADNFTWLRDQVGIDPRACVAWNVVPWFIGNRDQKREVFRARPWLERFLSELDPQIVVCMGNDARDGWNALHAQDQCRPGWLAVDDQFGGRLVLWCPHTSYHNIDGGNAKKRVDGLTPTERIVATLHQVNQRDERT